VGQPEAFHHRVFNFVEIAFQDDLAAGAAGPLGLGKVNQGHVYTPLSDWKIFLVRSAHLLKS
jgi:hypothetical protein